MEDSAAWRATATLQESSYTVLICNFEFSTLLDTLGFQFPLLLRSLVLVLSHPPALLYFCPHLLPQLRPSPFTPRKQSQYTGFLHCFRSAVPLSPPAQGSPVSHCRLLPWEATTPPLQRLRSLTLPRGTAATPQVLVSYGCSRRSFKPPTLPQAP